MLGNIFRNNFITLQLNENSEKIYGVVQQPSPTCPLIDDVINSLCNSDYDKLACKLENIRQHVKDIRSWGEQWKQLAIKNEHKSNI